ncbi:MAG: hypothetical protein K8F25_18005 [Fimbriimonadaceae bacterium]|nr:hypothetical protein [Alphaproteobacteria bacterium]
MSGSDMRRAKFPATGFVLLVAGLSLVLAGALSYFAMPAIDDFCYSSKVRYLGYVDATIWFYQNWIGRILATALINAPAALTETWGISLITAYQAMALAMVVAIIWFGVWAGRQLLPALKGGGAVGLVFAAALIVNARSIADLLYWLPASASYTVPALLVGVLFLVLIKNAIAGNALDVGTKTALVIFAFLASCFNEFTWGIVYIIVIAVSICVGGCMTNLMINCFVCRC